jgi:hypothetical protein
MAFADAILLIRDTIDTLARASTSTSTSTSTASKTPWSLRLPG